MEQTFQSFLKNVLPKVSAKSAQAVLELKADGATVPFMARYRKEKTGNLDEVEIRTIIEKHEEWEEINKRKQFILKEIETQGNLTSELKGRIEASMDLEDLEEIYRPYKKKKKTKATVAREAGLEPLADWIWQIAHGENSDATALEIKAKEFLNPAAGFVTYELVLKGAQDIIVEKIYNNADLRSMVREDYMSSGKIVSKVGKKYKDKSKYEMYADFSEPIKSLMEPKASHRYLAMRRGWQEGELTIDIKGNEEVLEQKFFQFTCSRPESQAADFLMKSAKLAFQNHTHPSISNELHRDLKKVSDDHAILVFAENVRQLLLASPFGARCVLGIDPGLRTGCKVALVDKTGSYISHTVLQILGDDAEEKAKTLLGEVTKQIQIDAIAVGNGTAGRQTEKFLRKVLKTLEVEIPVIMVNEAGASVYSASDVAREEFPDLDLTVKGAISIARRLIDPLAELVKIEPKSIGVGQYQHDVNQNQLKKSLEAVVESCVNAVGVDLNTASPYLLSYVSGIGSALAKNVVAHRKEKGLFKERSELLNVSSFSSKAFEQAAGFLRIYKGKLVLDATGVHPERYSAVRDMATDLGISVSDLMGEGAKRLLEVRTKWIQLIGEFTFDDIVKELEKPGRDPRENFKLFQFRDDIFELKDVQAGMICPGIVTNVTNFGAFVDIGVHQDGLVHISELSNQFVQDTRKVVKPGDQVTVKVIAVDVTKNQISLTMKLEEKPQYVPRQKQANTHERNEKRGERREGRADERRSPRNQDGRPNERREGQRSGGKTEGQPRREFNNDRMTSRDQRGGGKHHESRGDMRQGSHGNQQPRGHQQKPFNNPFASLGDLSSLVKK